MRVDEILIEQVVIDEEIALTAKTTRRFVSHLQTREHQIDQIVGEAATCSNLVEVHVDLQVVENRLTIERPGLSGSFIITRDQFWCTRS